MQQNNNNRQPITLRPGYKEEETFGMMGNPNKTLAWSSINSNPG